jgi:predicted membrane metal-binding protein
MPLVYIAIGWITGIALAALVPNSAAVWPAITLAGVVLVVLMRRDLRLRQFALLIAALGFGIWRYSSAQPHFTASDLATYNDKGFAAVYGTVVDTPDVRDQDVRLRVEVDSIQPQGQPALTVRGLAVVNADRFGGYLYGDRLRIWGEPITPPVFDTFSYRDYLSRGGVHTLTL